MALTAENYSKGFLIDEELIGGVSEHPEQPGLFVAFILRHTTGEYLGYHPFTELNQALDVINKIERQWTFEKVSSCGSGGCEGGGSCGGGGGGCGSKNHDHDHDHDHPHSHEHPHSG